MDSFAWTNMFIAFCFRNGDPFDICTEQNDARKKAKLLGEYEQNYNSLNQN